MWKYSIYDLILISLTSLIFCLCLLPPTISLKVLYIISKPQLFQYVILKGEGHFLKT